MSNKKMYMMTQEQRNKLIEASQPVPYIIIGGIAPESPQERANRAWKQLGDEMGFEYMTVEPVSGKDTLYFLAVPKENK